MAKLNPGKCEFCGKQMTTRGMSRHLQECKDRKELITIEGKGKIEDYFLLLVKGTYSKDYWLYIDVPKKSTLEKVDLFLRGIWLECCGHLSAFRIHGISYDVSPDYEWDFNTRSMNVKLQDVLEVGDQFAHEYDFGSTTYLTLKVIADYKAKRRRKAVTLLARNNEPIFECDYCKKPATQLCCDCLYDDKGIMCDECAENHECGEEMLLPIVNSPRTGVCGYGG